MFKNRSFNVLVGLVIAVLTVFSIGAVALNRLTPAVVNTSPLDWYFGHDHAIIDGDNNAVSNGSIPVGERYAALKGKQLEQFDAARFASANITTADEENAYRTTQPSLTGWWEYRFSDALHTAWYANHHVTTPAGPVIDATYTFLGKALDSANGCGLSRSEPDC